MVPFYVPEIVDLNGKSIKQIDDAISIQSARAFNTKGSTTIILPDYYDRSLFRLHTRIKLWRYDHSGVPSLFGDTIWFLKKIDHAISDEVYKIAMVDSFAMLGTRIVAYTSQTPYADKTLEEFGLITYNNDLRIDTMMLDYVHENFGALALNADRLNSYIEIERYKNEGPYGEKQSSWQQIDSTLSDLARQASANGLNLFYDLVPIEDGRFLFRIWSKVRGIDRGSNAPVNLVLSDTDGMISDIHDIEDYTDVATVCYALGYDNGPSQVIETVESPLLIRNDPFGRIEMTTNSSDSDIPTVLIAAGQQALNGRRAKRLVTAKVVENSSLRYGRDISYGDLLSIEVAGRKYDVAVNAVSVTWDESGEQLDIHLSGEEAIGPILTPGTITPGINLPVNTRPVANAGVDQSVAIDDGATMAGSAVDDGLPNPPAALTYLWSMVSGPGVATFVDNTSLTTAVSFDTIGTYVLRLTVSDSELFDDDDVQIVVTLMPTVPPDSGLIVGQELVAGVGLDGYLYRTTDFQTVSGSGGPTWDRVDTGIADTIYTWVVDPFCPGYIDGAGFINGWIVNDTDIYRVEDIFGTPVVASVYTFDEPTVSASFHWRTIAASFGAFFEEGLNPFLVCVSYYGATVGHTGTWVTTSEDAGVTWSAEVQVSAHYNTSTPLRFNPIAVFASPRVPGEVITAAYIETAENAEAQGYTSTDWGATWSVTPAIEAGVAQAGHIHVPWQDNEDEGILYHGQLQIPVEGNTPDALMPFFGFFRAYQGVDNDEEVYTPVGLAVLVTGTTTVSGIVGEGTQEDELEIIIAPPPDCVRLKCNVTWEASRNRTSAFTASSTVMSIGDDFGTAHTGSLGFSTPAYGTPNSGGGVIEWTGGAGASDWPTNNETIVSSPPTTAAIGARIRGYTNASAFGSNVADATIEITIEVLEIELDDSTIYTPSLGTATRDFKLYRVVGGVATEISPNDGSRDYGVNRGHFGVRAYDSDRQFVVASVMGNDVTDDPDDDFHATYISDDAGDTWAEVLAPLADSSAPANRPAYEAAFAGDTEQVLFLWGTSNFISYSSDFGATLDSRAGNLSSFGSVYFIGIAGGPTP